MIKTRTVLILGAGASSDFAYLLGNGLRKQLIEELIVTSGADIVTNLRRLDFTDETIRDFRDALRKSGTNSVDEFLEHRVEFTPVGKTAIADALIRFENPEALFAPRDSWYKYLFTHMNSPFDEFGDNALGIITFNYNRSLEEFLYQAVLNKYGKSESRTADALLKIPIVHVHGSLGKLPWQARDGRPYLAARNIDDIRSAADSIKIVSEALGPEFQQAKDLLSKAAKIVILGFGYHESNLDRLFSGVQLGGPINGSFFGKTPLQMATIKQILAGRYNASLQSTTASNCLDFLGESVVLD